MTDDAFTSQIIDMTDSLYRVCVSLLADKSDREDAVQEALKRAWQKRGALRDARYLKTWVTRILLNVCFDVLRDKRRVLPTDDARVFDRRRAPAQASLALKDALRRLAVETRVPILLHYSEGYSVEEISRILRLPQGTVKTRLRKGRSQLRAWMDGGEES